MSTFIIADDSTHSRNIIKNILTQCNYKILAEAYNGQEAYEKFKSLNPDVIIIDISMPVIDGLECIKKITSYSPDAKILALSAIEQKRLILTALKYGAKNYLIKPVEPQSLIEAIEYLLKLKTHKVIPIEFIK
jgi:two-component system chemotaxis response regulator CheY